MLLSHDMAPAAYIHVAPRGVDHARYGHSMEYFWTKEETGTSRNKYLHVRVTWTVPNLS
jgi:hypothetical protein